MLTPSLDASFANDVLRTSAHPMVLDGSNNVTARYVYGGHEQLIAEPNPGNSANDQYLLHGGSVGNVTHAVSRSGTVQTESSYDAFGNRILVSGSSATRFGYTGEESDAESGLLYLRARYYDPVIGRFVSVDPYLGRLAEPATQNRYAYVMNNPVIYTAPSGMDAYALLSYESAAGGFGHMAGMVGNNDIGYYFSSMGDNGKGLQGTRIVWMPTPEGAQSFGEKLGGYKYNNTAKIEASSESDLNMVITMLAQAQNGQYKIHASGWDSGPIYAQSEGVASSPRSYGLILNNCGRSVHSIFEAGGIDATYDVVPKAYFNNINNQ